MRWMMPLLLLFALAGCGGGGATTPPDIPRVISEVIADNFPEEPGGLQQFQVRRVPEFTDPILAWEWDFGAGATAQTSSDAEPNVTLTTVGTHTGIVRLRVAEGWSELFTFSYVVMGIPSITGFTVDPPVPQAGRLMTSTLQANLPIDERIRGTPFGFDNIRQSDPTFSMYAPKAGSSGIGTAYLRAINARGASQWLEAQIPVTGPESFVYGTSWGGFEGRLFDAERHESGWFAVSRDYDCTIAGCERVPSDLKFSSLPAPKTEAWLSAPFHAPGESVPSSVWTLRDIAIVEDTLAVLYASDILIQVATTPVGNAYPTNAMSNKLIGYWNEQDPAGYPRVFGLASHLAVTYTNAAGVMQCWMVPTNQHADSDAWEEVEWHPEVRQLATGQVLQRAGRLGLQVERQDGSMGLLTINAAADPLQPASRQSSPVPTGATSVLALDSHWVSLRSVTNGGTAERGIFMGVAASAVPGASDWTEHRALDHAGLLASVGFRDRLAFATSEHITTEPGAGSITNYWLYTSLTPIPQGPADWERRLITSTSWSRCGMGCHSATFLSDMQLRADEAGVVALTSIYDSSFQTQKDRSTSIRHIAWPE